jgi:aminocarboxymuconate-semialdehyde decarboxylase
VTKNGRTIIQNKGFEMLVSGAFFDLEKHRENMDREGIDKRVISLANPWFDPFPAEEATALAYETNQAIAEMLQNGSERFFGLAALPLVDTKASVEVLRNAIKDLGLSGAIIGSNFNGTRIDGSEYLPIFEEASKLDVPVFVHPNEPRDISEVRDYGMIPAMAFPFETTTVALKLIYSGLFLRCPKLKIFVPHLGGTLPYLLGRIDKGYELTEKSKRMIPKSPSYYVKRNFYSDTIIFESSALACGMEIFGPTHLTLGTDYPFPWGNFKSNLKMIDSMKLSKQDVDHIIYRNALKLLKVT